MEEFDAEQELLAQEAAEELAPEEDTVESVVVPKRHYVDNEKLTAALIAWKEKVDAARAKGEPDPRIPEYIGKCILDTAYGVAKKHNFRDYSYVEDMVMDGCENVVRYLANFNPNAKTRKGKPNAFAYLSYIMNNSFTNVIEKEKLQAYYKYKSLELAGGPEAFAGEDLGGEPGSAAAIVGDIMSKASEYEDLRKKRLEKARAKAAEIKAQERRDNPPLLFTFME